MLLRWLINGILEMEKKSPKIRVFVWLGIAALAVFALARVYYRATDDFRIANMTYEIPHHKEWEIDPLNPAEKEKLDHILSQKFFYIGKGAQSYAFGSEDQKYVLKFFKFKHLKPSLFVNLLPPIPPFKSYKEQQTLRKQKKLDSVFTGYRLAYGVHKEQSGIIFAHLNKTNDLHRQVTVVDKIGLEQKIDLDPIVFVVQEKARTMRTVMTDLLSHGELTLAQYRIDQIFDLYLSEYQKGVYDRDHGVMHNTGFVGDKPIHLDVGKLTHDESMKNPDVWQKDIEKIARKINLWISVNYPKVHQGFSNEMEGRLSQMFGRRFSFQDPPSS